MKMKCELIIEEDGKVVYRGEAKSFVYNFAKVLAGMLGNSGDGSSLKTITATDVNGSTGTVYIEVNHGSASWSFNPMGYNAGDNNDSYGIIVGSGTTPVTYLNYNLASKITHGTGTGQLDYDTHTIVANYTLTGGYIDFYRTFVNRSSADVVVREVGLVAQSQIGSNTTKYLVARDLLPTPVTVKSLGSLTVKYRISLSL
jgi:hypothetical protein